jgi:hypothetical protein
MDVQNRSQKGAAVDRMVTWDTIRASNNRRRTVKDGREAANIFKKNSSKEQKLF